MNESLMKFWHSVVKWSVYSIFILVAIFIVHSFIIGQLPTTWFYGGCLIGITVIFFYGVTKEDIYRQKIKKK